MDEPLAGLDRLSKDEILPYLEALHTALSIPILYVSHDIAEVERLADHLVLMQAGHVVACGPSAGPAGRSGAPGRASAGGIRRAQRDVAGYDPEYGLTTLAVDGGSHRCAWPIRRGRSTRCALRVRAVGREPRR